MAVILSDHLWRSAFAADPATVGRSILLRGEPYTVVGIMPATFRSAEQADLWTPIRATTTGEGGGENFEIVMRLNDRLPRARALQQMAQVGEDLRRERPPVDGTEISFSLTPLQAGMTAPLRQPILIVWAAVGILLLAASVNLAGLMLARAASRSRELATRFALGGGRTAIVRQLMIEAIVLGAAGGAAGVLIAAMAIDALSGVAAKTYGIWQPLALGPTGMLAGGGLAIVTSVVFGLPPAVHASRLAAHGGTAVAAGGSRAIAGGSNRWPRRALVVTQVALGVMLLVGAGLLLRTFAHLRALDPGFDPDHVVAAAISLEDARYQTDDRVVRLAESVIARLRQTPGVQSAAMSLGVPYERLLNLRFRYQDGPEASVASETPPGGMTTATYITAGLFDALRIPVQRGRAFDDRDRAGAAPVVIVNATFARTYFQSGDPIGRHIQLSGVTREVVGIVGDVQLKPSFGRRGPMAPMPMTFLPIGQVSDGFLRLVHGWFQPTFVVRSAANPAQVNGLIRQTIESIDPLLPLASVRTMAEVQAATLAQQQLLMTLLLALAAAAVVVSAIGIHGLIATSVTERTREVGVRVALGATAGQALRTLAMPGIGLAALGTAAGLVLAFWSSRLLQQFVWGISVADPITFGAVALLLFAVASAASFLPALRILRIDPAIALRHD
jgi:predicted permease